MEFKRPSPEQVRVGLAALKHLGVTDRAALAALQSAFGTSHDIDGIEPLGPTAVAARIDDAQIRGQIVRALIVFSLVDRAAALTKAALVDAFARALGVDEKAVANLRQLARRQHLRLRVDVLRRFWAIDKLRTRVRA